MKKEDLFQALGEIDDNLLDEDVTEINYSFDWVVGIFSLVACIAFTVGLVHFFPKPLPVDNSINESIPFSESEQTTFISGTTFTETVQTIPIPETEGFHFPEPVESTSETETETESTSETSTFTSVSTETTFLTEFSTQTEPEVQTLPVTEFFTTPEITTTTTSTTTSTTTTTETTTTTTTTTTESTTTTTTTENPYASLQNLFTEVDGVYYAKEFRDESEWIPDVGEVLTADGGFGATSLDVIRAYPDKTYAVWIAIANLDADEESLFGHEDEIREKFNTTFTIEGYTLEQAKQENNTRILSYFNRSSTWKYVNIAELERLTAGTCEIIGYNLYFNRIWINVTKEQLESLPFSNHFGYLVGTMTYQDENYFTLK